MEGWQRAFVLHSRPWSETSLMLGRLHGGIGARASGCQSARSNALP